MLIIPAIDIRDGKCVRLYQGRKSQQTVYGTSPVEMAMHWKEKGATMLHIADLDGAFAGKPINLGLVAQIRSVTGIPVEVGGGFRDMTSIDAAMRAGIDRVILGTVAVYNPDLVRQAVETFGPGISVSIDVAGEFVAVAGWEELSGIRFEELAQQMREFGVSQLLFTDTRKDGTLSGPNLPAIRTFLQAARLPVIVSGGVCSPEDIHALLDLESLGIEGVVIGKALYDKKLELSEAIRLVQK